MYFVCLDGDVDLERHDCDKGRTIFSVCDRYRRGVKERKGRGVVPAGDGVRSLQGRI